MRAAVVTAADSKVAVQDVTLGAPGPGEVRVAIRATGVCHSDLSIARGRLPWPLPAVLGHEAAGEVVAIGDGVRTVAVGARVVVSLVAPCRRCFFCAKGQPEICTSRLTGGKMDDGTTRFATTDGAPITSVLNCGTFAEETVVRETAVVEVGDDVPFEIAALIGCAVTTGTGAVFNTARITPGEKVVVIGLGGVGLSVVQAARIAGASAIIAVDPVASRRDAALAGGATHACAPDEAAPLAKQVAPPFGPDAVFDAAGIVATQKQAVDLVRPGGQAIFVGMSGATDEVALSGFRLSYMQKTLKGCFMGSTDPVRDVPIIVDLWRTGRLDLASMITARAGLDDVEDAFAAMESGTGLRTILIPE